MIKIRWKLFHFKCLLKLFHNINSLENNFTLKYIRQWFYYKNVSDDDFRQWFYYKNALDNDFIMKMH